MADCALNFDVEPATRAGAVGFEDLADLASNIYVLLDVSRKGDQGCRDAQNKMSTDPNFTSNHSTKAG